MQPRPRICAVVPAYQCAASLPRVIQGIHREGLECVVIDDGSTDGTAKAARQAGVRVLHHGQNRGKGSALVTGFRWALARGASHVLTLDADGQHEPAEISRFLALVPSADLVIGKRAVDLAHMPTLRLVGNRISSFFVSLVCGEELPDTQCGFRLYSKRLLTLVPLRDGRFETETELLMRAHFLGLEIHWVPVSTNYGTACNADAPKLTSHFHPALDTLRVMRVVLASGNYPRAAIALSHRR